MRRLGLVFLAITMAAASAAAEDAGRVVALVAAGARNGAATRAQETFEWRDRLTTDDAGRMRAALLDGSVLSLGSATELVVTRHDPTSQQTELELLYGKLRSMVAPLRGSGRSFQVKTPTAVIGVTGTDFFLEISSGHLRVVCFAGMVTVTSTAASARSYTLPAGQMLDLDPGGAGTVKRATLDATRAALERTSIQDELDLAPHTRLTASITRAIDEKHTTVGAAVVARLEREIRIGDLIVVPKGAELLGAVTDVQKRDAEHPVASVGIAFTQLRLPEGRTMKLRSVIDGIAAPNGLDADSYADAQNSFGRDGAERSNRRPPLGLAAPQRPLAVPAGRSGSIPLRTPTALPNEPLDDHNLTRAPAITLSPLVPIVQPRIAEGDSGAIFKSSHGVHLSSGTVLVIRTLAP
jgi:hypothetical protein